MGGMNIYSATEPKAKEGIHDATGYKIHIKLVKSFDVKTNPKILLLFLNKWNSEYNVVHGLYLNWPNGQIF